MERRQIYVVAALLFTLIGRISSISVTVNDVECVYEYVLYEGDTVSGNFVVVDHDIFWSSDHPGIDLTVSQSPPSISSSFHSDPCFVSFSRITLRSTCMIFLVSFFWEFHMGFFFFFFLYFLLPLLVR